ncbi:aminodeoxychorismate lyase [Litchfieldia salsa]|uniref:4-amino-4-deoxychorismate lyase n=1 Tax=Litchfieldia salsa TaxID=930152 RepID=A0A1H0WZ15_9BACI|nr:aminodeoxychorismate lyase [Litchfieldia salsa]SDP95927.1 4-amino-4-deoxychorismate lyase [Litchfieldia salsa]
MFIYLNGEIIKEEEARITPFDHGYIYGLGVFETFRVYDGHPFLFDDHLMRLRIALQELNIRFEYSKEDLLQMVHRTLEANGLSDAYIRFNVSAGKGEIGLQIGEYGDPTVIIFAKPLPKLIVEKEAVILNTLRNTPEGPFRLKSHHYLNNIYAKRELGNDPRKEGLLLTKEGYLSEGITSNLFWVKNQSFYTPSLETGILNGITRSYLKELIYILGYKLNEGYYSPSELMDSDEIFITNSIQEIVHISAVNNKNFAGHTDALTSKLQRIYKKHRYQLWSKSDLIERKDTIEE